MSGRRIAAMIVNDNRCFLDKRGVCESFAGKPAPTGGASFYRFEFCNKKAFLADSR
ncbi:hypothetical protein EMIT0P218_320025 [Pseudomonas sp. IT-P218]